MTMTTDPEVSPKACQSTALFVPFFGKFIWKTVYAPERQGGFR
jgi:hypothetical protein